MSRMGNATVTGVYETCVACVEALVFLKGHATVLETT